MADLRVSLCGVPFKNPIVITASSLTNQFNKLKDLADAGAGGLITKAISPDPLPGDHRLGVVQRQDRAFIAINADQRLTMDEGTSLLAEAKRHLPIPVIANVIGRSDDEEVWSSACRALESAGAAMLELDLNCHPEGGLELNVPANLSRFGKLSIGQDPAVSGRVVAAVKRSVTIPVIAKLTPRAPDMLSVAHACSDAGADALSGMNALSGLMPIDTRQGGRPVLSGVEQHRGVAICGAALAPQASLQTALLATYANRPYLSGGGVMSPDDAVQRLMLGATLVGVCSAVYQAGLGSVTSIVGGLEAFLDAEGYRAVEEVRGLGLQYFVKSGDGVRRPVVAEVQDQGRWQRCGAEVMERVRPECQAMVQAGSEVTINQSRCTGCTLCLTMAPEGTITMVERTVDTV